MRHQHPAAAMAYRYLRYMQLYSPNAQPEISKVHQKIVVSKGGIERSKFRAFRSSLDIGVNPCISVAGIF